MSAGGSGSSIRSGIGRHRPQVVGHVLADLAVPARRAALEHAVPVDQRDRQAVDLRLGDELELGVGRSPRGPGSSRIRWIHALRSSAEWALASDSIGWGWVTFSSSDDRLAATRWVGESGVTSSGCSASSARSSLYSASYCVVADLGVVEDVVAVGVVVDLLAQLGRARLGSFRVAAHGLGYLARRRLAPAGRGRSARAPTSPRGRSGRSGSGVTAILPSAIAARSVPASSCPVAASP